VAAAQEQLAQAVEEGDASEAAGASISSQLDALGAAIEQTGRMDVEAGETPGPGDGDGGGPASDGRDQGDGDEGEDD
jgi:hypothetical protein